MKRAYDHIQKGDEFGLLTAVESHTDHYNRIVWICSCLCGRETVENEDDLRTGRVQSCGCSQTKGFPLNKRPEYRNWYSMMRRCQDPNRRSWPRYGGRGIRVCERWQSFQNFLIDMGPRPSPAHTIDRIDNDGNYEPGNCRWATKQQQSRNSPTNNLVFFSGRTLPLIAWAEYLNINYGTLLSRLQRGLSIQDAFGTPVRLRNKKTGNNVQQQEQPKTELK